jgi:hypothetical protein
MDVRERALRLVFEQRRPEPTGRSLDFGQALCSGGPLGPKNADRC